MKERCLQIKNKDGLRYTSSETIEEAKIIFSEINAEIVNLLRDMGATAVGLRGEENGLIKAQLKSFETYGYVGDVKSMDVKKLGSIMAQGEIPVISTLGSADDGQVLNINADDAASAVASSLHADKFILLTDVTGILQDSRDPSSLISTIDDDGIETLLEKHIVVGGMARKLKACREAVKNGVPVVCIQPPPLVAGITDASHCGTQVVGEKSHSLANR
jgi:acetylglutamate kinase